MTRRVLGVIPARGGSKGVPRKNLRAVAGRALLEWSVEAAAAATLLDQWVVSTEDAEIARVARAAGAAVLDRPADLAGDAVPTSAVVAHAVDALQADVAVVLHPTSPIRAVGLVDRCVRAFLDGGTDSLGTVHPDFSYEYGATMPRRQDIHPRLVDNGNVYVLSAETLRAGRWIGNRIAVVETSRIEGIEIDDEFDLWLAEQVLTRWKSDCFVGSCSCIG